MCIYTNAATYMTLSNLTVFCSHVSISAPYFTCTAIPNLDLECKFKSKHNLPRGWLQTETLNKNQS